VRAYKPDVNYMSREYLSAQSFSPEEANEDRRRADRIHIRQGMKNLIDWISQSGNSVPNKDEVLQKLKEILVLVPSKDVEEEAYEEEMRLNFPD
jgi:hypothetical protein